MSSRLAPPKVGPFRPGAFASPARSERTAAVLGLALGVSFGICFLTGLYSHLAQHPPSWFHLSARPAGLYRITQGLHVATGLAAIPLLLAKLWTVFPKLFSWPPFPSVAVALERICLLPLVGGSLFLLFSGLANINLWYPWPFNFPLAHYWTAWITIGALIVHIGAKVSVTRRALRRSAPTLTDHHDDSAATVNAGMSRRQLLATAFGVSGLVTLVTVGQTYGPLRKLALLAPRRPDVGPQGFPVNRTARAAGVLESARSSEYRLEITGRGATATTFDLAELQAMTQHRATLPIACVEGWSTTQEWEGVRLRDLLRRAGVSTDSTVRVESLQPRRSYRTSNVDGSQTADPDTLLALRVNGAPLDIDHGYPLRLIAPNRPGVMQTKWVTRVVVL
ncbi:MAG: molybdopterin-dependent oxidoreductase [Acidimicrobiia bacterium]|nr:molybdopterin-dependent oxidoreductase [Acidimicrobiia bacterium]